MELPGEYSKKEKEKIFLDGYLAACQFIVMGMGMDSVAENAIRESGYSKTAFMKSQKDSDFNNRKMNAVIKHAFRKTKI